MSYASAKGYRGERAVLDLFRDHDRELCGLTGGWYYRPRAGSNRDRGDIGGLPYVVSVKNCRALALAEWVDALPAMCESAGLLTGVVVHKRVGQGDPANWYVTTSVRGFLPFHDAYLAAELSA